MQSEGFAEYFEFLKNDFFTLRVEWRLHRSLFGTNKETVELLNAVSGPTMNTLERVLFERTLLGIRKLNDTAGKRRGKNDTVSIKGLLELVARENAYSGEIMELRKLVSEASKKSEFARDWSNKRIAHSDLNYKKGAHDLEAASRQRVEVALNAIADTIKWVGLNIFDTTLVTHPMPPLNDERALLRAIYTGYVEIEKTRLMRKKLQSQARWQELENLQTQSSNLPDWLNRDDPPIDVD